MAYPDDYCNPKISQGGHGGNPFNSFRASSPSTAPAYVVCRIECWVNSDRMYGIQVYYSNAATWPTESDSKEWANFMHDSYGKKQGTYSSFIFNPGELLAKLTVYKAKYNSNDYCGGLSFTTSSGREFTARSHYDDEATMVVGYGLCVGIYGDSGDAIDRLGLGTILPADNHAITHVTYNGNPGGASPTVVDNIVTQIPAGEPPEPGSESYSCTQTTTQGWSVATTNTTTQVMTVSVSAQVYEVSTDASYSLELSNSTQTTNSNTYSYSITVITPFNWTNEPGYITTYTIKQYTGSYILPYTGLATLTLNNRNVLSFYITGSSTGSASSAYVGVESMVPIT